MLAELVLDLVSISTVAASLIEGFYLLSEAGNLSEERSRGGHLKHSFVQGWHEHGLWLVQADTKNLHGAEFFIQRVLELALLILLI